ncbi:HNH endonuclease domain-containing protein [Yersinia enterocolitica]|nr:HNH endonuclease domain-containing protein [Yersinia enterocolitica]
MSLSLPGNDLYCLSRDNLPPEEYERIISAYAAWSRICREYEFDDRNNNGRYIINMRENRAASHLRPSRGAREKDKLEKWSFPAISSCLAIFMALPGCFILMTTVS